MQAQPTTIVDADTCDTCQLPGERCICDDHTFDDLAPDPEPPAPCECQQCDVGPANPCGRCYARLRAQREAVADRIEAMLLRAGLEEMRASDTHCPRCGAGYPYDATMHRCGNCGTDMGVES